jgi:cyclopropane fatty-acyl-phospholipid synthase-like methyltransferase
LDEAERSALEQIVERADLHDGQRIIDLGCGWGSVSLYLAKRFPNSQITGVSNSASQRRYIMSEAKKAGLANLRILTADMNVFQPPTGEERFDRAVSIEMFEHMKGYGILLKRISEWLKPDGKLFVHIFVTHHLPYHFDPSGWMGATFFTGGIMPSRELLYHFQDHMKLRNNWIVDGTHYEKTCYAWLERMDAHKKEIMPILRATYGSDKATLWWMNWRMFYIACAVMFGFNKGQTWTVAHYLFEPSRADEEDEA